MCSWGKFWTQKIQRQKKKNTSCHFWRVWGKKGQWILRMPHALYTATPPKPPCDWTPAQARQPSAHIRNETAPLPHQGREQAREPVCVPAPPRSALRQPAPIRPCWISRLASSQFLLMGESQEPGRYDFDDK